MLNLSAPFIKRPVMTTLVVLAVAFFGIVSYKSLPVSDLPNVEFPTIEVDITYPGADPITISNNVITPLEEQFTTIEGIQTISSTSVTGSGTLVLQFSLDRPIDAAATDVLAAINAANQQLPQDLPYIPSYTKSNPTATPILMYVVGSNTIKRADMYTYAHTIIGERLNMIEGVSEVLTYGSQYAVRIQVDPQKLAARGIGLNQFAKMIKEANVYLPTGTLYGPKREFTIDCEGQINEAAGYNEVIVKAENGLITRVKDVGIAKDSLWNDKYTTTFYSKEVVQPMSGIALLKQPGSNTLDIIEKVKKELPMLEQEIPGSIDLWLMYDQSEYIKASVFDVEMTLLIALGLVVFVIFIYLGKLVNTLIPSLAIPVSILGTFIMMHLFGFTIDILSLLAITLSIGFLVDDAIVVLENIARLAEKGEDRYKAALDGSKQISFTVLSMTICLCSVFIPLMFMEGIIGRLLHEFSLTIVTAVLISGVVSLTFTPMLSSRFIASYKQDKELTKVEKFSAWFNGKLLSYYKPSLEWALRHRKTILTTAIGSLGASIFLIMTLPKDFLPADDIGFIQGFALSPDGTSPFETEALAKEIALIANQNPYVDLMVSLAATQQDNQTMFFFRLVNFDKRPSIDKVVKMLHEEVTSQVSGVQLFLKPLPLINLQVGARVARGAYQYTLRSLNSKTLYKTASALQAQMEELKEIKSVSSDLDITQPQLHIDIDRDKASVYGITALDIENALSFAYADVNLSPINEPDNQYYVIMETLPEFYDAPDKLSQLWLTSPSGKLVPFTEIVTMTEGVGPLTVNKLNGLPAATISFDLAEGVALETALNAIEKIAGPLTPPNVFGKVEGAANIFKQSFANLNFLLLVTFFVVYVILGILYENFFHPITVMSTLPPAALGGLLCLLIFGYSLSLYAFVGIVMLLGIVMKNGIIMVDFANEAVEKEGKSAHDAIYEACVVRFRPILMTTFAATMGALPIAIGFGGSTAQTRRPLGVVIVGGLIFSQILTLYLTPVIYLYIERLRERLHKPVKGAGETE